MQVDIGERLIFPTRNGKKSLWAYLALWSSACLRAYMTEPTVSWEEVVDEAYEHKKLRYYNLAAKAEDRGWTVEVQRTLK